MGMLSTQNTCPLQFAKEGAANKASLACCGASRAVSICRTGRAAFTAPISCALLHTESQSTVRTSGTFAIKAPHSAAHMATAHCPSVPRRYLCPSRYSGAAGFKKICPRTITLFAKNVEHLKAWNFARCHVAQCKCARTSSIGGHCIGVKLPNLCNNLVQSTRQVHFLLPTLLQTAFMSSYSRCSGAACAGAATICRWPCTSALSLSAQTPVPAADSPAHVPQRCHAAAPLLLTVESLYNHAPCATIECDVIIMKHIS